MHSTHEWILDKLPLLALFAMGVAYYRYVLRHGGSNQYLKDSLDMQRLQLDEFRRHNDVLAKSLDNMNRRLERLEDADRNDRPRT